MARLAEKRTDAILDGEKDSNVQHKSNEEFIEETVAKCNYLNYLNALKLYIFLMLIVVLQKAGSHMEFTFLASYIVMLMGFLIMDNDDYQTRVRQFLKDQNFTVMVEILKKFFNFMNLTASVRLHR